MGRFRRLWKPVVKRQTLILRNSQICKYAFEYIYIYNNAYSFGIHVLLGNAKKHKDLKQKRFNMCVAGGSEQHGFVRAQVFVGESSCSQDKGQKGWKVNVNEKPWWDGHTSPS